MRLVFTLNGWADHRHWQTADPAMLRRIHRLLDDVLRDPAAGIGKPEALSHLLSGCGARRIDPEHRLVYLVDGEDIVILQARFHYDA